MARHPNVVADIATASMKCHECMTPIRELSIMFMRALRDSEPVDGPFQALFPLCRGCFEHEMARRVEEMRL
jgi:hypothetical protein